MEAAVRETREESGLEQTKDYEIWFGENDFKIESNYRAQNNKPKRVIYWLAEAKSTCAQITLSSEHKNFKWVELNEAVKLINFDDLRRVMQEVEDYIIANIIK